MRSTRAASRIRQTLPAMPRRCSSQRAWERSTALAESFHRFSIRWEIDRCVMQSTIASLLEPLAITFIVTVPIADCIVCVCTTASAIRKGCAHRPSTPQRDVAHGQEDDMAQIGSADSRVTYDLQNQAVRMWFDPSPVSFSKNSFVPRELARGVLSDNAGQFRWKSDLPDLRDHRVNHGPNSYSVRYTQEFKGI